MTVLPNIIFFLFLLYTNLLSSQRFNIWNEIFLWTFLEKNNTTQYTHAFHTEKDLRKIWGVIVGTIFFFCISLGHGLQWIASLNKSEPFPFKIRAQTQLRLLMRLLIKWHIFQIFTSYLYYYIFLKICNDTV